MQKVLICTTTTHSMRCEIEGWDFEDGDNFYYVDPEIPIGLIDCSPNRPHNGYPKTICHALGMGWKILTAPTSYKIREGTDDEATLWDWWLIKD